MIHEEFKNFERHWQQNGYVILVITLPNEDKWKETFATQIGLKRNRQLGGVAISWLRENGPAWSVEKLEELDPRAGYNGFAVRESGMITLRNTLASVLEHALSSSSENSLVRTVYRELGVERKITIKPPLSKRDP